MLAGVWLKDTLKAKGLIFLLAVMVFPEAVAANQHQLIAEFGFDARTYLLVGIFAGSMVFAVFAGGIFLRAAKRSRQAARLARESAEQLDTERASIRSLIAAEPQVLVKGDRPFWEILHEASRGADLVFKNIGGQVVGYITAAGDMVIKGDIHNEFPFN